MNKIKNILFVFLLTIYFQGLGNVTKQNLKGEELNENKVSQIVDSLNESNPEAAKDFLHSYRKRNDIKREGQLFVYNKLAKSHYDNGNVDSAKHYYKKALQMADDENLLTQKHEQNLKLASFYYQEKQYEKAKKLYKKAIDYYRENGDSVKLGSAYSRYGTVFHAIGKKETAYSKYQKAIKLLKNSDQFLKLGAAYENIAYLNVDLGYEKRAIKNIKQAVRAYEKLENKIHLAQAYAELGVSYKQIELYDSALYYYQKSDSIALENEYPELIARNTMNKGNIYDLKGDTSKALQMYQKSLEISQNHNLLYGQYLNCSNIGDWYRKTGECHKALSYMKKALEISDEHNFPDRDVLLNNLANTYARINNMKKAYQFMRKYASYKDSLYKKQKHKELMDLQTKYETKKKEAEILQLDKEKKQEKLNKTYITAGALLLILVLTGITVWLYQKRKIAIQKAQITEKENENIKAKLEIQNKDLISNSLHLANLQDIAQDLSTRLRKLKPYIQKQGQEELQEILDMLKSYNNQEKLWEDFDYRFKELNPQFLNRLLSYSPDLTDAEVRLCSMLYLNMSTKDIALVTNRSIRTVENLRYRVRNKLNLKKEENLTSWLYKL